jgi:hypothetical protein
MSWHLRWTLCLLATLGLPARARADETDAIRVEFVKDFKGPMAGNELAKMVKKLGKPTYVSREIMYRRTVEQRFYETPQPFFVEVEYRAGREARILSVRLLREK